MGAGRRLSFCRSCVEHGLLEADLVVLTRIILVGLNQVSRRVCNSTSKGAVSLSAGESPLFGESGSAVRISEAGSSGTGSAGLAAAACFAAVTLKRR